MPNIQVFKTLTGKYMLTVKCIQCKTNKTVTVEPQDYFNWNNGGQFVQNAFPYLDSGQRELLISGICGECFDKIFEGTEE